MKIGVWLGDRIVNDIGGGASYVLRLIQMIDQYRFSDGIEMCFITLVPQCGLTKDVVNISRFPTILYRISSKSVFLLRVLMRIDKTLIRKKGLKNILLSHNVKIIYYLNQSYCFDDSFPFISTNWDIGHRSTYSFPELVYQGSFESREKFYNTVLPKALMVICESEAGKRELVEYAKIGTHKIRIMPMFAGGVNQFVVPQNRAESILRELGLERYHYFFYPAQFWAHKNHIGIVNAFSRYVIEDKYVKLVFTGSDKGNLKYIKEKVEKYGLVESVLFLGFVPDETLSVLYKYAKCLIMASHFGPTNMPPIEAMEAGCPVICSDLEGHREMLDESAVYFNSFDSNSIFEAMMMLTNNREDYVKRIERQRSKTIFNDKFAIKRLDSIMQEVVCIRNNWD